MMQKKKKIDSWNIYRSPNIGSLKEFKKKVKTCWNNWLYGITPADSSRKKRERVIARVNNGFFSYFIQFFNRSFILPREQLPPPPKKGQNEIISWQNLRLVRRSDGIVLDAR